MIKKILSSVVVALCLITNSSADMLGAEVGYAVWNPSLTGAIRKGADSVDFEKDLGFGSKEANGFVWAYIDHPVPFIPNIKIQKTNYTDSAQGIVTKNFTFTGYGQISASDVAQSEFTLNQLDVIPYWRVLDNWVNFDIGLNFKSIDGNIKIDTSSENINENFDVVIPMLYSKARFDLPFTGASIEADISYVSYSGNKFSDIKAGVVYETSYGLGATTGFRKQNIALDDIDNIYGDINIEGIYAGLFFHF